MRVAVVGAGKIGLPMAVALDSFGHDVMVTDVSPAPQRYLVERAVPYREEGLAELLASHGVKWGSLDDVVDHAEVVFVTVQTPHAPGYDGATPAPAERRDFEYGFLVQAVRSLVAAAEAAAKELTVVVVSTVLPGTFNRHLRPLFRGPQIEVVYSPCFIAMGTTIPDFTHPEFVLIGSDRSDRYDSPAVVALTALHRTVHDRPIRVVSIESAELTKVAYNVYVSSKIAWANYVGELAERTGADADEVTGSLALATDRLLSPRYMTAGMGDGCGCHPRDLIALSWLAERTGMSSDLPGTLIAAREAHSEWLASLALEWSDLTGLPIIVLGKACKPGTDIVAGSPAGLLAYQLGERVWDCWDPHVDTSAPSFYDPAVYFVATRHPEFPALEVPAGSVVVDPFGYMPDREGVTVVRPGRH